MAQNIMKPSEINVNNLKFSEPKKLPNGGNKVYVNSNGGTLYVQTPEVKVLWDTKFYPGDNEGSGNYPVVFSLSNMESNSSMKAFHDMLASLDEHIVNLAYENRKAWFGAKLAKANIETIQQLYTPMVKVHIDKETGEPSGKFPPSFGLKINMWDGKHQCKVYNQNKELFNIDDKDADDFKSLNEDILVKGTGIKVLLKCHGIWIISGKFGCTWRAEQVKVKLSEKVSGYAFRDDDDDDNMDVVEDKVEEDGAVDMIVDSDSDSDTDSEEEQEPVKKPVKKRGVKKQ